MSLEVQIQILARTQQSFHFQKIPGGLNINIFFVKVSMKLPFTLKNKRIKTNLKFDFSKVLSWTPEKARFWFYKKNPPTNFFLRVVALIRLKNNRHTNVLLFGIFENTLRKSGSLQKRHFGRF